MITDMLIGACYGILIFLGGVGLCCVVEDGIYYACHEHGRYVTSEYILTCEVRK